MFRLMDKKIDTLFFVHLDLWEKKIYHSQTADKKKEAYLAQRLYKHFMLNSFEQEILKFKSSFISLHY